MIIKEALDIIKNAEGLKLKAYKDPAGIWTIGYGHIRNVKQGDVCTEEQADKWLREDIGEAVRAVDVLVNVPLTQQQYGALVSFTFNLGYGTLKNSSLLTALNKFDYKTASEKFLLYNKAGGKVLPGLVLRRKAERELFDTDPNEYTLIQYATSAKNVRDIESVKRLQEFLKSNGTYTGKIDGIPGRMTSDAMERTFGFRLKGE